MAKTPPVRTLQAPGASPETAYELPPYDSPRVKPTPVSRQPGRSGSKNRAPAQSDVEVRLPGRGERLAPDDRLARPEVGQFGEEVIDGVRMECMAAVEEHADPQSRLNRIVGDCLAKGYVTSTELLTRTEKGSDFATDVCVRKVGVDPETGGRYLEEISFEVANTQTFEDLKNVRVPKLVACGVRRVFVLLVQEGDVLEWSVEDRKWIPLTAEDEIRDPVFVQPLEVKAILDAAHVDQLVSKAQLAKKEPHLMGEIKKREKKARVRGEARGEARGLANAILRLFKSRGATLDEENRQSILECQDVERLERLFDKVAEASSASEILAELEAINEGL